MLKRDVVALEVTEPVKVTFYFRYIDVMPGRVNSELRWVSSFYGLWAVEIEIDKKEEGEDGDGFAFVWMMTHGV